MRRDQSLISPSCSLCYLRQITYLFWVTCKMEIYLPWRENRTWDSLYNIQWILWLILIDCQFDGFICGACVECWGHSNDLDGPRLPVQWGRQTGPNIRHCSRVMEWGSPEKALQWQPNPLPLVEEASGGRSYLGITLLGEVAQLPRLWSKILSCFLFL